MRDTAADVERLSRALPRSNPLEHTRTSFTSMELGALRRTLDAVLFDESR